MSKLKRIHIIQHNIRWNKKNPNSNPKPIVTVKCGGKNYIGGSASILGPSKAVYSPDKPLSCGARVWIETKSIVILDEPITII